MQALKSDRLRLGSLDPRRDLTYVSDTAAAMVAAACTPQAVGRTIQLGTGRDVSIGDIVEMVGKLLGKSLEVELDEQRVRPPDSEVGRLISSPALAQEILGWRPVVDLAEGLQRTIGWVEQNSQLFRTSEYVR